ncbi:ferric reductase-like transmembrane domain-containing protein [Tropicimonas sediminicola]|uniref:Ferric reductase like transmembrane component n=1 Tax=Tropicimonas sediminicola TaxID=1031541 RepID=A0A239F2X8_9RHOB|nr:ferric reductase-like transmembrane domain-containing protein [Tropicimonas sediminicola]SNS51185.1 Ferric reductase like transmembrane component [Tropicimonas sediminicola]
MKRDPKALVLLAAITLFAVLPLAFYVAADVPRRSSLKEGLSILTVLALVAVVAQFFLARSLPVLMHLFKAPAVQRVHKVVGYCAIALLAVHPCLIVLPRYLEAGVRPLDALVTLLTQFESLGVVLGLAAWASMVLLVATAYGRMRLIRRRGLRYRSWRSLHGGLAVGFVVVGLWHAIELGRHTGLLLGGFLLVLAAVGLALLLRLYLLDRPRQSRGVPGVPS